MCDDGCNLFLSNAVCPGVLQMISQGGIGDAGGHQGHYCNNTLCLYVDGFLIPYLSEEHIIIEMREHGSKLSKLLSSCCLYDLFTHDCLPPCCPILRSPADRPSMFFADNGIFCAITSSKGFGTEGPS